jgi:hypothetical protein
MTTKGTVKLNIMADSSTTAKLFAASGRNQNEKALRLMKEHSLDPESGAPTPRTKAYIATGEWDAKERIGIRLIVDDNCAGRIEKTVASPSGVEFHYCSSQALSCCHQVSVLVYPSWSSFSFGFVCIPKFACCFSRWSYSQVI